MIICSKNIWVIVYCAFTLTILESCASKKFLLPCELHFNQNKRSISRSLNDSTLNWSVEYENDGKASIGIIVLNKEITLDNRLTFQFILYLLNNKLAAIKIKYDIHPKLNYVELYRPIVAKYGAPSDSSGVYAKQWRYTWESRNETLKMKSKREEHYGDIIVIEYIRNRKASDQTELIKKLDFASGN